ncbi:MAG: adenylyltransferase/cytidyltransferase family protein [Patescibacteria group bacterium]|nr:adenylyltransferase/cytidyltransferase family protein [Patescibacteria group bacterium]
MKTGFIVGKFMPPHKGHLALIDFALKNCDSLIIAVCSRPDDPTSGSERLLWMRKLFKSRKNIKFVSIKANLPRGEKQSRAASDVWCKYIKKRFGKIDVVFSSEKYGDYLAKFLSIEHKLFDLKRKKFPISATQIRNNSLRYSGFIAK